MDEITKEDFEAYVDVQMSGVTNMMAIGTVSDLSGLTEEAVKSIMENYGALKGKYGVLTDATYRSL